MKGKKRQNLEATSEPVVESLLEVAVAPSLRGGVATEHQMSTEQLAHSTLRNAHQVLSCHKDSHDYLR